MDFSTLKNIDTLKSLAKGVCGDIVTEVKNLKTVNVEKAKTALNVYFVDYLKNNYLKFDGRVSRRQYWMFALYSSLISIIISFLACILPFLSILSLLYVLAILVPSVGLGVRRLHDIDLSGWFFLICLIPFIGGIALILLFCLPGDTGKNKFDSVAK